MVGESFDGGLATVDLVVRPVRLLVDERAVHAGSLVIDVDEGSDQVHPHLGLVRLEPRSDLTVEGPQQASDHRLLL